MALSKTWKELLFDVPHLAVPEDLGRVLCSSWHNILRRCQCLAEAVTLGRINVWKKAVSLCLAKQRIPRRELAWCSASHACRLLMVSEGYWVKKLAPPACTTKYLMLSGITPLLYSWFLPSQYIPELWFVYTCIWAAVKMLIPGPHSIFTKFAIICLN